MSCVGAEGPWEPLELGDAVPSEGIVEGVESREYLEGPQPQRRKLSVSSLAYQKMGVNPSIMKSRQFVLAFGASHPGNVHA